MCSGSVTGDTAVGPRGRETPGLHRWPHPFGGAPTVRRRGHLIKTEGRSRAAGRRETPLARLFDNNIASRQFQTPLSTAGQIHLFAIMQPDCAEGSEWASQKGAPRKRDDSGQEMNDSKGCGGWKMQG